MPNKLTYTPTPNTLIERTYTVTQQTTIGTVWPTWTRANGKGWTGQTTDGTQLRGTYPTRQQAAQALTRHQLPPINIIP